MSMNIPKLRATLEVLMEELDASARRAQDPVELVWRYESKRDREIAGLIASGVAYGRVALVKRAGEDLMQRLGDSPADALMSMSAQELEERFDGFVYRMTRGADVVDLLWGIKSLYAHHDSLDAAYGAMPGEDHVERASALVQAIRAGRHREDITRGLKYLLSDPGEGSTAKRLHLFFRWVVRGPDAIDLGIWEHLDAADLIMPLDTHTSRICRYVGLLERKTLDGKAAKEVADNLRKLDPRDPLKYDFPLCHLGISKGCIHARSQEHCPRCPLEPLCTLQ